MLTAGLVACEETWNPTAGERPAGTTFDYGKPSQPRDVVGGRVLGVAGGLRLLQLPPPDGSPTAPGCDVPRPELGAVPAGLGIGDVTDPAPGIQLAGRGDTVLTRVDAPEIGGRAQVAVVASCGGTVERVWVARVDGTRLADVRVVPDGRDTTLPLRLTAWSLDGRSLLGVERRGPGLAAHRLVALDVETGSLRSLGAEGYWVGEAEGAGLIIDQGDRVVIGSARVPLDTPPEAAEDTSARSLAIAPDGRAVAVGTDSGLVIARPDGTAVRWHPEPVAGPPAWSPEGTAVAYVSRGEGGVGPLRVSAAGAAPVTVTDQAVAGAPIGFSDDGVAASLVYTASSQGESGEPDERTDRVTEVMFGKTTEPLPTTPESYAIAAVEAWRANDPVAVARLVGEPVASLLAARPARASDHWAPPECESVVGSTYCLWAGERSNLLLRVDEERVSSGADRGVVELFVDPPPKGSALWPFTTTAEAEARQAEVDAGASPWLKDPVAVASALVADELLWPDVDVVMAGPGLLAVVERSSGVRVEVALFQPARIGEGGIWAVQRLGSAH